MAGQESQELSFSVLQLGTLQEDIRFPRVKKYYYASRLFTMMEWGRGENRQSWDWEQRRIPFPLKDWVLMDPVWRAKIPISKTTIYKATMAVRNFYRLFNLH